MTETIENAVGDILKPEEYAAMHKTAFRVAFNFLNAHFPPEYDLVWWEKLSKDASAASVSVGEDRLTIELIAGIMNYLEYERKLRGKHYGETEHPEN